MEDANLPSWVAWLVAAIASVFGTGGLTAWYKARSDNRLGVAASDQAEDAAISERWRTIVETQTQALLDPMREEIQKLKEQIDTLEEKLVKRERQYWKAITHIRSLMNWIAFHVPEGAPTPPIIPPDLSEDI